MTHLSNTKAGSFVNETSVIGISRSANTLIQEFEKKLNEKLLSDKFQSHYKSIDDILTKKYHLEIESIENSETPNYKQKTEFIIDGVRGNFQKANGNVLSYSLAEEIISDALDEELP